MALQALATHAAAQLPTCSQADPINVESRRQGPFRASVRPIADQILGNLQVLKCSSKSVVRFEDVGQRTAKHAARLF
ncbi:hypothetical protein PG990_014162 [Apiospora arundinis]